VSDGVQLTLVFCSVAELNDLAEKSGMHQRWCVGSSDCVCQQEQKWWDVGSKTNNEKYLRQPAWLHRGQVLPDQPSGFL